MLIKLSNYVILESSNSRAEGLHQQKLTSKHVRYIAKYLLFSTPGKCFGSLARKNILHNIPFWRVAIKVQYKGANAAYVAFTWGLWLQLGRHLCSSQGIVFPESVREDFVSVRNIARHKNNKPCFSISGF